MTQHALLFAKTQYYRPYTSLTRILENKDYLKFCTVDDRLDSPFQSISLTATEFSASNLDRSNTTPVTYFEVRDFLVEAFHNHNKAYGEGAWDWTEITFGVIGTQVLSEKESLACL